MTEGSRATSQQKADYASRGYVKFDGAVHADVSAWTDEISQWPKAKGKWLIHWEASDTSPDGKVFCRADNFVDYHNGMNELAKAVGDLVAQVVGKPVALFKEKINYKLPGAAGFSAHQDSSAYLGYCDHHISAMVLVDAATDDNGPLEIAPGVWGSDVPLTASGILTPEAEATAQFNVLTGKTGDVVLFDGWTPHRSIANKSNRPRRAIFFTYNIADAGDFHALYYKAKHDGVAGFDGSKSISFQGDFQGRIVE